MTFNSKSLPHDHPDLATTNSNIGVVYQSIGEYSTALSYFKKTLEIQQQSLPRNHPHLATTNNNIGAIYQSTGEYSTALSILSENI